MLLLAAALSGSGALADDMWYPKFMWGTEIRSPSLRARIQRHWTFLHSGVPPEYAGAQSTEPATPARIAAGRAIYRIHCASCHRMDGLGGGDAAYGLTPSPALLANLVQRPEAVDEYLLWTISDGGRLFKTDMPAFRNTLTRDEIWKVVAFMRAGFDRGSNASK